MYSKSYFAHLKFKKIFSNKSSLFYSKKLPGASTRDPTYDKVMRRKPDRQGGSGFQGFRKAAPGAHLKDDIFLMLASIDDSLISVTQAEGLPRSLSK